MSRKFSWLSNFPWVTITLVLLNSTMYLLVAIDDDNYIQPTVGSLLDWGANFSGLTLKQDWWRLITSMFLHGGALHLLFNMYALLSVGIILEAVLGHLIFFGYYLIAGIGASLVSLICSNFIVSVGASGAIFGLIGFYFIYIVLQSRPWEKQSKGILTSLIITIVINIAIGFSIPFIDNAAHIGGLLIGIVCALVFIGFGRKSEWTYRSCFQVFIFSAVSCLLCYSFVFRTMSRDRAEYYDFFLKFLKVEREALRIQSSSFTDQAYRAELDTAHHLWTSIKVDLDKMDQARNKVALKDRSTLNAYVSIRQQELDYLRKMVDKGSFQFLDSVYQISAKMDTLSVLTYPLDFYPTQKETDSLKAQPVKFDKDWCITTNDDEVIYTREAKVDKLGRTQGWAYDFYPDHKIQMKGFYRDNLLDGITFYFYPNGNYKSIGIMSREDKKGTWQNFYQNGQLQSEIAYYPEHASEMIRFFDSTGVQLVVDGNGRIKYTDEDQYIIEGSYINHFKEGPWYGYYSDGSPYYKETYKEGRLIQGMSISSGNKKNYYTHVVETPVPATGWEAYQQYVDSSVTAGGKHGSKGVVSIELFVDSTGAIKSMKPKMIIGSGCEDTVQSIIKRKPKFLPGKVRGQATAMRTYIFARFY